MPYFDTKYGRKNFSYATLAEYKKALDEKELACVPMTRHELFGEVITEVDVSQLKGGDCAFGSEFQTIGVLKQMLENYENSDSQHSIPDFYTQSYAQHLALGSRARYDLVQCHAMQNKYKNYQEAGADYFELLSLAINMKQLLEKVVKLNNTSIATGLTAEILLEGQKKLDKLHSFDDHFTRDLNDTINEVEELFEESE